MTERKRLVIFLPHDAYQNLERLADREERPVYQQASYLLRRVLAETESNPNIRQDTYAGTHS